MILESSSCSPPASTPLFLRKESSLRRELFSCLRERYSLSSRFRHLLSLSSYVRLSFSYLSSLSNSAFLPFNRFIYYLSWYAESPSVSSSPSLPDLSPGDWAMPALEDSLILLFACCTLEWMTGCL
jgi:hypothetical protein